MKFQTIKTVKVLDDSLQIIVMLTYEDFFFFFYSRC